MATVTAAQKSALQSVYIAYFNRPAEPDGYKYYLGVIERRLDEGTEFQDILDTIAKNFANSVEAQTDYPFLANPTTESPETFLLAVYKNAFNRDEPTDSNGFKFWMARLTDPTNPVEPGLALLKIMAGAVAGGNDRKILDNKAEVAQDYTTKATNDASFEYNDAAKAAAKALVASVDGTATSVTTAKAQVDSLISGVVEDTYPVAKAAADAAAAAAAVAAGTAATAQAAADTAEGFVTDLASAEAYKAAADTAKVLADTAATAATTAQTTAAAAVAAAAKTTDTADDTEAAALKTAADTAVATATAAQTTAAAEVVTAAAAVTANAPDAIGVTINLTSDTTAISPNNADPATKSTADADTINAPSGTFTSNTNIDGGGSTDTIFAIRNSNGTETITPTLANVEKLFVTGQTGGTVVDLSNATGLTEVWSKDTQFTQNSAFVDFNNIKVGTNIGVEGTGDNIFLWDNSLAPGNNETTLFAVNATNNQIGIDKDIDIVNLKVDGASSLAFLDGPTFQSAFSTMNVSGTGNLTLTTMPDTIRVFDASTLNGSVTATDMHSTDGVKITGSKQVDTFVLLSTNNATDTIVYNGSNVSTKNARDTYTGFDSGTATTSEDKIDVSAFALTGGKTTIGTFTGEPDSGDSFNGNAVARLTSTESTIYVDSNNNGIFDGATDLVINITGAASANLDASDFIF